MTDARKRPSSSSPIPWQQATKDPRRAQDQDRPRRYDGDRERSAGCSYGVRKEQDVFAKEQARLNQIQEAEQMREWVSKEDEFVLRQSKKKARIRVKEGRAKSVDWLAVTLGVIDATKDLLDDDNEEVDTDIVDPAAIFEGLTFSELQNLSKDIDTYLVLETNYRNRQYWSVNFPLSYDSIS